MAKQTAPGIHSAANARRTLRLSQVHSGGNYNARLQPLDKHHATL
ncbi:MAG: hypothetical protein AB7V41_08535 [Burkholderiaceae bacterium]